MAHTENRSVSRAGARHRAAALSCLLLAGSLTLIGCSSGGPRPDAKVPAGRVSSVGKPASASSVAAIASNTAGTITATSLSDAQLGYTVTATPVDLGVKWVAILQDLMAYNQMSWKLWIGGGWDTSKVPAVITGNPQRQLINDATTLQNMRQKTKTLVKVAISEVAMSADGQSATVSYCVDMTQVIHVDAQGKDATEPSNKTRIPAKNTMAPGSNRHWLASEEEKTGESNTCKVG